ncbi:MAG TPA: hypothetical protein VLW84_14305 [Terriglobales bacterium]|nr:hypothetical protein [Terriglobales bacterium]
MSEIQANTCAHIPCSCTVPAGEKYCSESCEDAGAGDVEIACECGHAGCAMNAVEENIA